MVKFLETYFSAASTIEILCRRAAAYSDPGDQRLLTFERHSAAHSAVFAPQDRPERKELLPWLQQSKKFNRPYAMPTSAEVKAFRSDSSIENAGAPLIRCVRTMFP